MRVVERTAGQGIAKSKFLRGDESASQWAGVELVSLLRKRVAATFAEY